jgi:hypothetical protein
MARALYLMAARLQLSLSLRFNLCYRERGLPAEPVRLKKTSTANTEIQT